MGKTFEKVRMWNIFDEEKIKKGETKPIEVEAQIDNGATGVVITQELANQLNLLRSGTTKVRYADERKEEREVATGLRIEILGRDSECRAIIEPNRKMPLIGQIILEDMDLWIDSKNGRLFSNPESPEMPLLDEFTQKDCIACFRMGFRTQRRTIRRLGLCPKTRRIKKNRSPCVGGFMHWIKDVTYIKDYRLKLQFENDEYMLVDLQSHLDGKIFRPLKDISYFKAVKLNEDIDTIVWPNNADFSPDFLYEIGQSIKT